MTVHQVTQPRAHDIARARRDAAHFIGGAFTQGTTGKSWQNRCPLDNSVIGAVPEGGRAEVDAAVKAARAALDGPWGKLSVTERTGLLGAVADEINRRFDDFLEAECLDTGKPMSLASHIDIPRGAANFKMFTDVAKTMSTECFTMPTPDGKGAINYALRRPKGVIAVISPWNLPLLLDDVEGRPGAGLRQHGRGEALRGDAPHRDASGRGHEQGGRAQGRLQRGAWLGARIRPANS